MSPAVTARGAPGYEHARDVAARRRMQDLGEHVLEGIDLIEDPALIAQQTV
jgi:hypothetical protein